MFVFVPHDGAAISTGEVAQLEFSIWFPTEWQCKDQTEL